jgi:opacity protein-like surface antigen
MVGVAYADIGGFGIEDSSELSWQVFGGFGYRLSDTWSAIAGYRYLSIERDVLNSSITADLYGPQIGVQVAF